MFVRNYIKMRKTRPSFAEMDRFIGVRILDDRSIFSILKYPQHPSFHTLYSHPGHDLHLNQVRSPPDLINQPITARGS